MVLHLLEVWLALSLLRRWSKVRARARMSVRLYDIGRSSFHLILVHMFRASYASEALSREEGELS